MQLSYIPQCSCCKHRVVNLFDDEDLGRRCAAFPAGILPDLYRNLVDHRRPYPGDGGIRWESNGEPYPDEDIRRPRF